MREKQIETESTTKIFFLLYTKYNHTNMFIRYKFKNDVKKKK